MIDLVTEIVLAILLLIAFKLMWHYYRLWQKARTENTNLIINMLNQKEYLLDKACEWLTEQGKDWWQGYGIPFTIKDFRKAMEDDNGTEER